MNDDLLVLTADAHQSMIAHALAGLPHEACGLFAGPGDDLMVDQFFPMTNAAASREIYVLDGNEMLEVEAQVDADQRTLVGVMHSHTHTTAYPSPTDVADAGRFDPFGAWIFIIVSLKHPNPSLRAYRILDGTITEVPVAVDQG